MVDPRKSRKTPVRRDGQETTEDQSNGVRNDPLTGGGLPQEDVEDRPNVSVVTPEDYPLADRTTSKP